MKILYVVSGFAPAWGLGGGVRVSYELSKEMASRGHDIVVYTTDILDHKSRINYRYKNWEGVKTYYFKTISNYLAKKQFNFSLKLIYLLYKNTKNFDLIHIHEYRTINGTFAAYFAKMNRVPYIIQPHGSLSTTVGMKRLKKMFDFAFGYKVLKNAAKVIALNEIEFKEYEDRGIDSRKVCILPNGIDISKYEVLPPKGIFKSKYKINDDEKIILFLGRINKIKGINTLVESFGNLSKQICNLQLVIAGPDNNGFVTSLKKQVSDLKIEKRVLFTGPLYESDKLEAYVDADVVVYPSYFEIFGLVPLEAIMCGTPVIVTDNCGCSKYITESECGYLIKYGDAKDLETKIRLIIENNCKFSIAKKGKKYIQSNLAYYKIAKDLEATYEECIY
jgi:glycosyltransferase involved in cell wall biosynthesis